MMHSGSWELQPSMGNSWCVHRAQRFRGFPAVLTPRPEEGRSWVRAWWAIIPSKRREGTHQARRDPPQEAWSLSPGVQESLVWTGESGLSELHDPRV